MKSCFRILTLLWIATIVLSFSFGSSADNVSELTIQSATGSNLSAFANFSADKIIDGNTTTVSRGGEGGLPSWTVTFDKEYIIKEVELGAYYDGMEAYADCYYFNLYVNNTLVLEQMAVINGMQRYALKTPIAGSNVTVQVVDEIIRDKANLAEVIVYGSNTAQNPTPDKPDTPDAPEVPDLPDTSGDRILTEGISSLFAPENIMDGDYQTYSGATYNCLIEQSFTICFEKSQIIGEIYLCCADGQSYLGSYDVYVNGTKINKDPLPAISHKDGGISLSLSSAVAAQNVKITVHDWEDSAFVTLAEVVLRAESANPACPHDFSRKNPSADYLQKEATCTQPASYFYLCSLCDAVGTNTYTNGTAGAHKYENNRCIWCNEAVVRFVGASLTLQDNIAINFKVNPEAFTTGGYTKPLVIFQFGNEFTVAQNYTYDKNGRFCFTFDNLAPRMMNDTLVASLIATKDGQTFNLDTVSYSIRQYCYAQLDKCMPGGALENDTTFQTLLVDLLYYGAAAQIYCGYDVNNLPTSGLNATQKSWATATLPPIRSVLNAEVSVVENPICHFTGASLILDDAVTLRFIVKTDDPTNISVKIQSTFCSVEVPYTSFQKIADGKYYVYLSNIAANNMRAPILATAYKNGRPVSNTLCYSVESYAHSKLYGTAEPDAKLNALLTELMKYGVSAEKYVATH